MSQLTYDLTQLNGWVRRLSRDEMGVVRDVVTSDGSGAVALSATGTINLTSVMVDGSGIPGTDTSVIGSTLLFDPVTDAPEGAQVVALYTNTLYSDDQIDAWLADAAVDVGADLNIHWKVDPTGYAILNVPTHPCDDTQTINGVTYLHPILVKLIVLKSAVFVYADKSNTASDDAAIIRDGDTLIDTSKAATAAANTLVRMEKDYAKALDSALIRRQHGASYDWTNGWGIYGPYGPYGIPGGPADWPRTM